MSQCKTFLFDKRPNKTWHKGCCAIVGLLRTMKHQRSDSGTNVERPSAVRGHKGKPQGVAGEKCRYAGSGGQGGNVLRIEELMTRSGPGSGPRGLEMRSYESETLTHSLKSPATRMADY